MKPHRVAVSNVLESMDSCDATRSHERLPSHRFRRRQRRTAALLWAIAVAALYALLLIR